jgi:hypothetical protein
MAGFQRKFLRHVLVEILIKNYWNIPEPSLIVFSDFSWLTIIADIFSLQWTQPKSSGKGYK